MKSRLHECLTSLHSNLHSAWTRTEPLHNSPAFIYLFYFWTQSKRETTRITRRGGFLSSESPENTAAHSDRSYRAPCRVSPLLCARHRRSDRQHAARREEWKDPVWMKKICRETRWTRFRRGDNNNRSQVWERAGSPGSASCQNDSQPHTQAPAPPAESPEGRSGGAGAGGGGGLGLRHYALIGRSHCRR